MRVVVTTMWVAGKEECEGGMAMATVKRMAGKRQQHQQRGQ